MWHQKAKGPPDGPPIFLIFVEKLNCPQSQAYQSISPVGTGLSLTDRALGVSLGTSIGNYSPLIAPQPVKLKIQFWQQSVGSSPTFGTISRRALGFAAILLYKITTLPNGAVSPRKGSLSCRLFAYIHAHGRFGMLPKYCWASFFANDLQTEPGCNSHPGFSLPRSKKSIAGFCQLNLCHCVL